jgi:fructoselysine-6-P-deglycase FrlB-like protein
MAVCASSTTAVPRSRWKLPVLPEEFEHFVFLGTGWTIGLAHEAALKIREMAEGWSESYPAMDFRHGPMAAAGPRTLVWMFGQPPARGR